MTVADARIEATPLELRDADMAVRSIRLVHPSRAVREAAQRWLEPFEKEALDDAKRSLACHAGILGADLVSIRCIRFREWEPDPKGEPGMQGGSTEPEPTARTWQIEGDRVRVVTRRDVFDGHAPADPAFDAVLVTDEGDIEECAGEPVCVRVEGGPAFRKVVRRLLE